MASAPRTKGSAIVLAATGAALLAGSCTSLWGIDELTYDGTSEPPPSSSSSSGGGGTTSSTTSSTSSDGGSTTTTTLTGTGGGLVCSSDCEGCVAPVCAAATCQAESAACLAAEDCSPMVSCMHACAPEEVVCQADCIAASPLTAPVYYDLLDCAGCADGSCAQLCEGRCTPGCSTGAQGCTECINSSCAHSVCANPYGACMGSSACVAVANCVTDCAGDSSCKEACAAVDPAAAVLYRAWGRCIICTRPACWDICAAENATCRLVGDS